MFRLKITHRLAGRAVALGGQDRAYIGRNYRISAYGVDDGTLTPVAEVPCPRSRKLMEPFRLLCRLFRHEIRGFVTFPDGGCVAATRQGVYYGDPGSETLKPAELAAPDVMPPMTITVDSRGRVLWGEYWSDDKHPRKIRLFVSDDRGRSYEPVREFPRGEILHIHSILEDVGGDGYWLFVGDHDHEPGIARIPRALNSLDWIVRGEQRYRAVSGFIFADRIIYATDTEREFNAIYVMDKASGRVEKIRDLPGSSIYACRFGRWYAVSTSVEYFQKHDMADATLWVSRDALKWEEVFRAPKDLWPKKYFQFGSIVLPRIGWDRDTIVFSGQALKGIDDEVCIAEVIEEEATRAQ